MTFDLESYATLSEPVGSLGLSKSTVSFLAGQGIETVMDLMDVEWATYPAEIADEIRAAATRAGLREEPTPEPIEDLSRSERIEREWERVAGNEGLNERLHIFTTDKDWPIDFELLVESKQYQAMEELWVEHCFLENGEEDDFRPWLDAFAEHPPPLGELTLGGWSGSSDFARLGPVAPAVKALRSLRSLLLTGVMDSVEPLSAPRLTSLHIESGQWSRKRMMEFFSRSKLPQLRSLELSLDCDIAPEAGLALSLPSLRNYVLGGVEPCGELLQWLSKRAAAAAKLEVLTLNGWPEEAEVEQQVVEGLVSNAAALGQARITLPIDAEEHAARLHDAGLDVRYGDDDV